MNDRKIPYYQDYCEHYLTIIIRYPPNEWKHCNRIANRALLWFNTEITEDDQIFLKALFAKDIKSIVMKQWRSEQRAHFFKMGMKNTEDWCFTQQTKGIMINPHQPRDFLLKFGKKYGLNGLHPHALRHTMATLAIANGADVVSVSRKLGHATPTITLNVYAHENEAAQRKMNETYAATIYQDSNEA